jgi:hypothetical protein
MKEDEEDRMRPNNMPKRKTYLSQGLLTTQLMIGYGSSNRVESVNCTRRSFWYRASPRPTAERFSTNKI